MRAARIHRTERTPDADADRGKGATSSSTGRFGVGNQANLRGLQSLLPVGAANDPLEREADAAADRAIGMADPQVSRSAAVALDRKSADGRNSAEAGAAPAAVHDVLRAPGRPLDAATRDYFEPRFGQDFGQVRIHADAAAQGSAGDVDAQAYSVGRDIVFGPGKFAPDTLAGRHLLAHELAHVVQQDGAATPRLLRAPRTKPTAQYGDIKPHGEQGRARWDGTVRLSEHEHIRARINLWLQTFDPQTGTSPYDQAAYGRSSTITIPKDMANIKTRMDMRLRDGLRAAQISGVIDAALLREVTVEADIERTVRARDQAIEARRGAGLSTADLDGITPDSITRTAHYQQGELFEVGKAQRSPIAGATDAEIDAVVDRLGPAPEPDATPRGPVADALDAATPSRTVEPATTAGGETDAPKSGPSAPTGPVPRPSARQQALGAAEKTGNVVGLAAAGGEFIRQLYEGDRAGAAKTAGLTAGAVALAKMGLGKWAGPLAWALATYQAYDDEVKKDANNAGARVEEALGEGSTLGRVAGATTAATVATGESAYKAIKAPWEAHYTEEVKRRSTGLGEGVENFIGEGSTAGRVAGALTTSVAATTEVAFDGTFGVAGKGIGQGLAAGYLWLTGGDDEYEVPAYYEQFAANVGRFNRARAHLNQLTATRPDSSAAAGQLLKQIGELEAINSRYRQEKTWTYLLSAQASAVEERARLLNN